MLTSPLSLEAEGFPPTIQLPRRGCILDSTSVTVKEKSLTRNPSDTGENEHGWGHKSGAISLDNILSLETADTGISLVMEAWFSAHLNNYLVLTSFCSLKNFL